MSEQTPQPEVPAFLKDVDPAKRDAVLAKLAKYKEEAAATIGDGAPSPAPGEDKLVARPAEGATALPGKDVDWSEYDLDYNVKHLYPNARYQNTPQGPKWVALVDEFYSTTKDWRGTNMVNGPRGPKTEPQNLGAFLGDMLNGPEGWNLISVLPASGGQAGVLLRREVPVLLPDPKPLETKTVVEAPKDEELAKVQAAGDAFAAEAGTVDEVQAGQDAEAPKEEQQ